MKKSQRGLGCSLRYTLCPLWFYKIAIFGNIVIQNFTRMEILTSKMTL
jgi:hypothetical protein